MESYPLDEAEECQHCRRGVTYFDAVYAFGNYEDALRKLLHLFKYGRIESLAKPLSALLLRALPRNEQFDLVVAMPMHWRKRMQRGFNQTELLARPVARRLGTPMGSVLKKVRSTAAQAGLDEAQRQKNLKHSFGVKDRQRVAGKRILLIDDVMTTGATLRAASKALKAAGAKKVTAATVARVDRPAANVESF